MPFLRTTSLAAAFPLLLLAACENQSQTSIIITEAPAVSVTLDALPVYVDANRNGDPDAGDQIVVQFDRGLVVTEALATDFESSVEGDSLGAGATVGPVEGNPRALRLRMGEDPRLRTRGTSQESVWPTFAPPQSATDIRVAAPAATTAIESLRDAEGSEVFIVNRQDLVPGFAPLGAIALPVSNEQVETFLATDVDCNGQDDFLVVQSDRLVLLLSLESGEYQAIPVVEGESLLFASADIDCDGDRDLAVASSMGFVQTFLFDRAMGSYVEAFSLGAEPFIVSIRLEDLNADKLPDLLVVARTGLTLHLGLPGVGGDFAEPEVIYASGDQEVGAVDVADVDRNGTLDILIGQQGGPVLLPAVQHGVFGTGAPFLVPTSSGDFPAPEDIEFYLPAGAPSSVGSLITAGPDGLLHWEGGQADIPLSLSAQPAHGVCLADLDGDASLDLVATHTEFLQAYHFVSLQFRPAAQALPRPITTPRESVQVLDHDRDGDVDILTGSSGELLAYSGSLVGTWGLAAYEPASFGPEYDPDSAVRTLCESGDLDGDGWIDLLVAGNLAAGAGVQLTVYLDRHFSLAVDSGFARQAGGIDLTADLLDIELVDVDRDGDLDMILAMDFEGLQLWCNDGSGAFTQNFAWLADSDLPGAATSLASADLNGDGWMDVVVGTRRMDFEYTLFNLRTPGPSGSKWLGFDAPLEFPTQRDTKSIAIADLDCDGDQDVVIGSVDGLFTTVWFNPGGGQFSLADGELLSDLGAGSITIEDLDGDGDQDLLIATLNEVLEVWTLDASQSAGNAFTLTHTSTRPGLQFATVAFADEDASYDLVLATQDSVSLILGPDVLSPSAVPYYTAQLPGQVLNQLIVLDLYGDGDADLVTCVQAEAGGAGPFWLQLVR